MTTKYVTYRNVATAAAIVRMENLVKFGRAVLEICSLTDRQTDRQTDRDRQTHSPRDMLIAILCSSTLPKRSNYSSIWDDTVVKYASAISEVVNNIYCYYYTVSSEMGLRGAM